MARYRKEKMGAIAAMADAEESRVIIVTVAYGELLFFPEDDDLDEGAATKAILESVRSTVVDLLSSAPNQFIERRRDLFRRFASLLPALVELRKKYPGEPEDQEKISESFVHAMKIVEQDVSQPWTPDARGEVSFCLETLERANMLAVEVAAIPYNGDISADHELARNYTLCWMWAQFNFLCLLCAISRSIILEADILERIIDGLRASVLAYAYVRQGYEIRTCDSPETIADSDDDVWDAEDEANSQFSSLIGLRGGRTA